MTSEELSYSDFLEEIIAAIQAGDTDRKWHLSLN